MRIVSSINGTQNSELSIQGFGLLKTLKFNSMLFIVLQVCMLISFPFQKRGGHDLSLLGLHLF